MSKHSTSKASVTELHLSMDNKRERESGATKRSTGNSVKEPPKKPHKKAPQTYQHCGSKLSDGTSVSRNTISIQNLLYPDPDRPKPVINVDYDSLKLVDERDSSASTPPLKTRGYDFTSSTNTHFQGWVVEVPKKFKPTCDTSTSTGTRTKTPASTSIKSSVSQKKLPSKIVTSQEMIDSQHEASPKQTNFNGPIWRKPCKESVIAGAPKPYVGTCPPNFEEIAKMSRTRQKFFLTQDPRKKYCLTNPDRLRMKAYSDKKEYNTFTKMVKHADNVCAGTDSQSSDSFICEIIDLENPMQLDFQGMDYMNTYQKDEQELLNQTLYRRIGRNMERKKVKAETAVTVERELQAQRLAIPECFAVIDRKPESESSPSEESIPFGKLFRAVDKPYNQAQIEKEKKERRERYKNLYLQRKERAEEAAQKAEALKKVEEEDKAFALAQKKFAEVVENIEVNILHTKTKRYERKKETPPRKFPHTIRETLKFKKELKKQNRIKRDEAKVKAEFFMQRLGKVKNYPEAELSISSDTPKHATDSPLSEQSSDDEDALEVGKKGDVFKLRGFHFKLGDHLRGKRHQHELLEGRKEKGCITREQWLAELAPKKETVKIDVVHGLQHTNKSPDAPDLLLFGPEFGFTPPKVKTSAVRKYISKELGRHYDRAYRKNLKLVRPRLGYSVKKFNLISFLYGDTKKPKEVKPAVDLENMNVNTLKVNSTLEYMEAKHELKKQRHELMKQKRLELLGIPCKIVKKSRLQTLCENSSSSDSDWVPEPEPEAQGAKEEFAQVAAEKSVRVSSVMRGNMPAPDHRETTLRRHPRHPRDYEGLRVPSLLFEEAVKGTGKPHMLKLAPDMLDYENVRQKKSVYAEKFEARHHHDHWNPTQTKKVDVHYQPKIVRPEITKVKQKTDRVLMENFRMANPPCNAFINMDLTMPKWDTNAMIAEQLKKSKRQATDSSKDGVKDECQARDFIFRSRPKSDFDGLDFPGRQEYLQFLNDVRVALYETKKDDQVKEKLVVDREALIQDLEEDLKSIETCLTSLSSSECTNLTNDSGSFLLMEGKTKIPLDYIRKSVVPFDEMHRTRFQLKPIDVEKEDSNPFRVLPFSAHTTKKKDNFFTFNTRLKNGMRLRLEVPVEDVRQKLMGRGQHKYPGAVTTDIDEMYVEELKNRPPVKNCNFKSGRSFIKDALRLKFESMLIQGQIVRTKIYDRLNEHHWDDMQKTKMLYERLFAKWEKREYEGAMSIVHQVKSYYDMTDALKREFREVERDMLKLNMDIVFIEGNWIRRIMLQNFHYLLGDQEWRYENDWIHRLEGDDNELESFEASIMKRNTVNIRQREKDDAWAIKQFFDDVYLENKHPILIVFPDAESFEKGIENLKIKTFVLLLEMHFTLSIHTELQARLETFIDWCARDLEEKQEYVERKCAKKYFMSDRADELKKSALDYLDKPIEESFTSEDWLKDRSVIAEVWREVVPANVRGTSDQTLEPIYMVEMMSAVVIELIAKFESINADRRRTVENNLRRSRAYERKLSRQAYAVERRIEIEMKKVRKNLEPPYKKPKRTGKLPHIVIKRKKKSIVVQEKRISEHTKFFFRAFHDEGDVEILTDARDSLLVMDTIQEQIVPFYFDHFLKLNGYTPNYNFKTQVELRDGLEMERVKVKNLVPDVLDKVEKWEAMRKKVMEDNITRNPKMYENVNF